jgi:hypothetical protein
MFWIIANSRWAKIDDLSPCSPLLGFEFSKAVATGPEDLLFC